MRPRGHDPFGFRVTWCPYPEATHGRDPRPKDFGPGGKPEGEPVIQGKTGHMTDSPHKKSPGHFWPGLGGSTLISYLVRCRYLIRWGWSAAAPSRFLRSASYSE